MYQPLAIAKSSFIQLSELRHYVRITRDGAECDFAGCVGAYIATQAKNAIFFWCTNNCSPLKNYTGKCIQITA